MSDWLEYLFIELQSSLMTKLKPKKKNGSIYYSSYFYLKLNLAL